MAKSATRAPSADALPAFMALLQEVLETRGTITFRAAKRLPEDAAGMTYFASGRVGIVRGLDPAEFADTLVHELVHLQRGPAFADEVDAEEHAVEDVAQTLLYGEARPPVRPALRLIIGGSAQKV